jgi:hypothetical protein
MLEVITHPGWPAKGRGKLSRDPTDRSRQSQVLEEAQGAALDRVVLVMATTRGSRNVDHHYTQQCSLHFFQNDQFLCILNVVFLGEVDGTINSKL